MSSHPRWRKSHRERRKFAKAVFKQEDEIARRNDALHTTAMLLGAKYFPAHQLFMMPDGSMKHRSEVVPDV